VSSSNRRRPGPSSYGPAANWPEGPFPAATDPATLLAVQTAAEVATAVRVERAARYWSQDKLADEAKVSRTTITRLEAGSGWVDFQVLVRVANVLELKVALVPLRQ
jgi:ribosome-binding protein aMBF1 (putative translation factor)